MGTLLWIVFLVVGGVYTVIARGGDRRLRGAALVGLVLLAGPGALSAFDT
ncbi:hypothetical protein [Sinosporangium siamense]|uniref:Uncharacterized protein n=1 Tax=Sinosporangium siamense TaxID=1367973 RepID=A0A919RKH4_9ACTN|nr:hypothetical protein [Sinosporangium siamense]GII94505.1 hypothetical protein Ssi02_47360 [Sinosporangium siamense]